MTIAAALSIATGGLANINSQLALVSQNVANASTPGYAAEVATQQSVVADGVGLGVRSRISAWSRRVRVWSRVRVARAIWSGHRRRVAGRVVGVGRKRLRIERARPHGGDAKSDKKE